MKDVIPENILSKEAKNDLNKLKKKNRKTIKRENVCYKTNEYTCSFQKF